MGQNLRKGSDGSVQRGSFTAGWPEERWTAIVVLSCLLLLILIRRGFRGVNVLGVRASVS